VRILRYIHDITRFYIYSLLVRPTKFAMKYKFQYFIRVEFQYDTYDIFFIVTKFYWISTRNFFGFDEK